MSTLATVPPLARHAVQIEAFGELAPISRLGGQGRVHRPAQTPPELGPGPVVVKLYRRPPSAAAAGVLGEMVAWSHSLAREERRALHGVTAWPLMIAYAGVRPVGIALPDVTRRFAAPFVMPSGRRERVLLALEHLLGEDGYLQLRGLDVKLDTRVRTEVAERVCGALGYLHRHAIVASDIAPSNLLVAFDAGEPSVCFIDCDSMVFQGRQALAPVETGDWNLPPGFAGFPPTRATDAYKLGLIVLRLFARSHDARELAPHLRHVPAELRGLLARALARDAINRPPAGEWQRALRQALTRGQLDTHYPGPAPRRRAASQSVTSGQHVAARPGAAVAAAPVRPHRPATHGPPRPAGATWLRPAVAVLWLIAGTALLALVLSRLFAAAVPTVGAGEGPRPPAIYQYYQPNARPFP